MFLNFSDFLNNFYSKQNLSIYSDLNLFYLWKPAGIPSTFGKNYSILDFIKDYPDKVFFDLEDRKRIDSFVKNQKYYFSVENEFGLLNRLDNDTSGLLYFAKNFDIFQKFKNLQKADKIRKIYYAKVSGKFPYNKTLIDFPIMHKNKSKMLAIKTKADVKKGRGKLHLVKTYVEKIFEDKEGSWLKVIITKGIRHQIRVHLASVGYPIIGDKLYGGKVSDKLHLFSVGIENLF